MLTKRMQVYLPVPGGEAGHGHGHRRSICDCDQPLCVCVNVMHARGAWLLRVYSTRVGVGVSGVTLPAA